VVFYEWRAHSGRKVFSSSRASSKTTTRRNVTKSSVCLIHNVDRDKPQQKSFTHRSRNQFKSSSAASSTRRPPPHDRRPHRTHTHTLLYFFLPLPFPLAARAAASSASRRSRLHRPSALSASAPLLCAAYAPPTNVAVAMANAALSVQNGMLSLLLAARRGGTSARFRRGVPSSNSSSSSSVARYPRAWVRVGVLMTVHEP